MNDPSSVVPPGAWAILSTPFDAAEAVDGESLGRLVAFYAEKGVTGLVALAVMGEGAKLDDIERERVTGTVLGAAGRTPVVVGVSAPSVRQVRRRIEEACRLGAGAVLLAPSSGMDPEGILRLYREAGREGVPIVLQDHPQATGVQMAPALIGRILGEVEAVSAVKNEAPPTGPRTRLLLEAARGRPTTILGGLGALSLLDELDEGAHGTMTGFAFPEVLVAMVKRYREGDREGARRLYETFLPWLVFEAMPVYSLVIRKAFLQRRGILSSAAPRSPSPELDAVLSRRVDELVALFEGTFSKEEPRSPGRAV